MKTNYIFQAVIGNKKKSKDTVKSYRKELWFSVPGRRTFINMTPKVEECLLGSGINEGLILVKTTHIYYCMILG